MKNPHLEEFSQRSLNYILGNIFNGVNGQQPVSQEEISKILEEIENDIEKKERYSKLFNSVKYMLENNVSAKDLMNA